METRTPPWPGSTRRSRSGSGAASPRARPRRRREGWPHIAAGHDTLIAAPTGSGKTLAGFLVCIDRLYRAHERGRADRRHRPRRLRVAAEGAGGRHRREPRAPARARSPRSPPSSASTRPTSRVGGAHRRHAPARSARAMVRTPPSFVVTTPESLYLLVTSASGRERAAHGRDRDRRRDPRRRARQARRAPRAHARAARGAVRAAARRGSGCRPRSARSRRSAACSSATGRCPPIVDAGHQRDLDLALELPEGELEAVTSAPSRWPTCSTASPRSSREHRTTLVFVNTRRLAERLAHQLGERLGDDVVAAHHGSLSKDRRHRVETRLRAGDLHGAGGHRVARARHRHRPGRARVPDRLAAQHRHVPAAGRPLEPHAAPARPKGRLYPLTRDELVECAALLAAVRAGRLDAIQPAAPAARHRWPSRSSPRSARRSGAPTTSTRSCAAPRPYTELDPRAVRRGASSSWPTASRPAAARAARYVHHDAVNGELRGRKGARLAAVTSGGAIPEIGDYRVRRRARRHASSAPSTRTGPSSRWRATSSCSAPTRGRSAGSRPGVVRVRDAGDAPPTVPFWMGEAPARTAELSAEVSALRAPGRRAPRRRRPRRRPAVADRARPGIDADAGDDDRRLPRGRPRRARRDADPGATSCSSASSTRPAACSSSCTRRTAGASTARSGSRCARSSAARSTSSCRPRPPTTPIVLSLGPHHSFPLDEVAALRARADTVEDTLEHADPRLADVPGPLALEPQPVAAGAALPRRPPQPAADPAHGGRRPHGRGVPAGRRVPGERRRPDRDPRPRARAPDDRRHAARGARRRRRCARCSSASRPATVTRALRRHHRAVGARARDPHRPAVRVPRRRGVPEPAHQRGARCGAGCRSTSRRSARSTPTPSSRCTPRSRPSPTTRRRPARPAVLARRRSPPATEWRPLWDELVGTRPRSGRSSTTAPSCGARPSVLDDARARARRRRRRRSPRVLRGHLELAGITTVDDARATPPRLRRGRVAAGLAVLEQRGLRAAGPLHAPTRPTTEWVARRLLARMHSYSRRTRRQRRRAGDRAGLHALPAALAARRARHPARRRGRAARRARAAAGLRGRRGRRGSPSCSPAGCASYDPAWLDRLCHDGEVGWLRLTPRARDDADAPGRRAVEGHADRGRVPRRPRLAARGRPRPAPIRPSPTVGATAEVIEVLRERGACFATELGDRHQPAARRHRARRCGTAWPAACSRPTASARSARAWSTSGRAAAPTPARLSRLLRGARSPARGRRALVARAAAPAPTSTATSSPRRWPSCCCNRWGVVFRDLAVHESLRVPVARRPVGAAPARGPRPGAGRAVRHRLQRRAVRAARAVEQLAHVRKLAAHRRAGRA